MFFILSSETRHNGKYVYRILDTNACYGRRKVQYPDDVERKAGSLPT